MLQNTYNRNRQSKEPDESWLPRDIDPNNPNVRRQPGTNRIYATFVLEVGYQHESYPELLRDAANKHFSPLTSVQLYTNRLGDFKPCYAIVLISSFRQPVSIDIPTKFSFTLTSRHLFFGVPVHLIPQTSTPDFIFPLERVRDFILNHF